MAPSTSKYPATAQLSIKNVRCYLRALDDSTANHGRGVSHNPFSTCCDVIIPHVFLGMVSTVSILGRSETMSSLVALSERNHRISFTQSSEPTYCSLQLNTWKGRLCPDVDLTLKTRPTATPHRLTLHLTYWWLFILLHRPFFNRKARPIHGTDKEIDHIKVCVLCV